MKFFKIITAVALLAVLGFLFFMNMRHVSCGTTIGIIQTASHPALDAVREGCIKHLQDIFGKNITFCEQNAQGSLNTAHMIAQNMHRNSSLKAIVTIGTMATQVACSVEREKMIVFSAVTDPQILGIGARKNVTGVSDKVDIHKQVDAIKLLVPAAKTVGIIFNPSEANSASSVKEMERELAARQCKVVLFGAQTESEMPFVAARACQDTDVILLPADNTVASAIQIIVQAAKRASKPVFTGDIMLVQQGVCVSAGGVDYFQHGMQVAEQVAAALKQQGHAIDFPVGQEKRNEIHINKSVAQGLGIVIPGNMSAGVSIVLH